MSTDVGRSQSIRILTDVVVKWNSGQSLVPFHINLNLTVRRDGQGHFQSSHNLPFYPLLLEPSMVKKRDERLSSFVDRYCLRERLEQYVVQSLEGESSSYHGRSA